MGEAGDSYFVPTPAWYDDGHRTALAIQTADGRRLTYKAADRPYLKETVPPI